MIKLCIQMRVCLEIRWHALYNCVIVRCTESTSLFLPGLTVPRGKTQVKTSRVKSMKWMSILSFVPCNALHVPRHVAVLAYRCLDP